MERGLGNGAAKTNISFQSKEVLGSGSNRPKEGECPVCYSTKTYINANYGRSPVCDNYGTDPSGTEYFPLELFHCQECHLSYIGYVVRPQDIYESYIYETVSSPGLVSHFNEYAEELTARFLQRGDTVVDIGGNDGTLLSSLSSKQDLVLINIDPSPAIEVARSRGIKCYKGYFDDTCIETFLRDHKPDVILANNMMANIPDIHGFVARVKSTMHDKTVFVVESSYLPLMIENKVVDFVYHEHLYYFSLSSMNALLARHGLEIFDASVVPTKGGSMRYFIGLKGKHPLTEDLSRRLASEISFYESPAHVDWFKYIRNDLKELRNHKLLRDSKEFCIYGASATTTTLMQLLPDDWRYTYMIDDNKGKVGLYSPCGGNLIVKCFQDLCIERPASIVISAWRFTDMIIDKLLAVPEYDPLLIIPLPYSRVMRLSDYADLRNACSDAEQN